MRVLTWNLFHGRALPPARGGLLEAFSALLAGWPWDVALLQEVPPWWPPLLAQRCAAKQRTALTSRNSLLPVRRALARRRPELMKSNGGGANAVLARSQIAEHHVIRLRSWPERRVAQLARLDGGSWVANYHGSTRVPLAEDELRRLTGRLDALAGRAPAVLGGDLNLRHPSVPGFLHVGRRDVDHLFSRGIAPAAEALVRDRRSVAEGASRELSDHPPLEAELL